MGKRKNRGGRPRELQDARTVPVKIEAKDIERARRIAAREGITAAELIRRALREYMRGKRA